jgi:4-amino-4-deoxy-L-arabinose transferase-like glycosyltransferase
VPKTAFARWLAVIALLALAVRIGYGLTRDHIPLGGDAYFYSAGADLLVAGEGFVEPATTEPGAGPVEQSASHPPLYLLYLAVASLLDPSSGSSQTIHMLWSCVLGSATVVLVGLAGRLVAGPRAGLLAAAFAAVYPNIWVHDGIGMSETMALFTSAAVILAAYRFWQRPGLARAAWVGVGCGAASLARAELVLTLPLVLVPLVVLGHRVPWRRRAGWLAAGAASAAAVVAPWVAFNLSRFEEPVYLTHAFGYTLAAANCDATYYGTSIGFKDYGCAHDAAVATQRPGRDPSEREDDMRREALRYVRSHRERLPAVVAARLGRIAGVFRPRQDIDLDVYYSKRERWVAEGIMYGYWAAAPLAVVGAVVLRRRRVPVVPLVAFPAIVAVAVAVTFAQPRYRAPAEAALVILAAVTVDTVVGRLSSRRRAVAPVPRRDERIPVPT